MCSSSLYISSLTNLLIRCWRYKWCWWLNKCESSFFFLLIDYPRSWSRIWSKNSTTIKQMWNFYFKYNYFSQLIVRALWGQYFIILTNFLFQEFYHWKTFIICLIVWACFYWNKLCKQWSRYNYSYLNAKI